MMRTPAKKTGEEDRRRVLRNLGSTITIGGSPKNQLMRPTRTLLRAASSSQQMAEILYENPISPAPNVPNSYRLVDGKENVTPNLNFAKRTKSTKLIDNSWVSRLNESMVGDFSAEFFNWLKKAEKDSNTSDFARLRKDLCELVGRYTLECSKNEK